MAEANLEGRIVRIGCCSGFWGDSATGAAQLVRQADPPIDYLVGDYLAEVTMGLLAKQRGNKTPKGSTGKGAYIAEFATAVWAPLLDDILAKGIKVITNSGGLDPLAAKAHLEAVARKAGKEVVVAAVTGDDLFDRWEDLRAAGHAQEFALEGERETLPGAKAKVLSVNAYLGAGPIAAALAAGAQVVVTGRCVDSALVLAPLVHEFGWGWHDWDRLAAGSLVGHLLECGAQCTGGNFTDWRLSANTPNGGWANMGFPIAECAADGRCVITKPPRTGGLVTVHTVGEQMLYEMGNTAAYMLPDVIVDASQVELRQVAPPSDPSGGRVLVCGTRGRPPTATYKCSATSMVGWKLTVEVALGGKEARLKGEAMAAAILQRGERVMKQNGFPGLRGSLVEAMGSEYTYGPLASSTALATREVVMRISAEHSNPKALGILAKEVAPAATGSAPGMIGFVGGGRPHPVPMIQHNAVLVDKALVPATITIGSSPSLACSLAPTPPQGYTAAISLASPGFSAQQAAAQWGDRRTADSAPGIPGGRVVPLISVAVARSGDKGNSANVGVIARRPEYYEFLKQTLTEEVVAAHFAHLMTGRVYRFEVPGIHALNFVLTECLGGGGLNSLTIDKQGKAYAQMLLTLCVAVPHEWALPDVEITRAKL